MTTKVYIVRDSHEWMAVARMFHDRDGYEVTDNFDEADLVQFVGGSDVSPELYGEKNTKSYPDPARDKYEQEIYKQARHSGKACAGICRGGQFLHVMNGGKMFQHIEDGSHHGSHEAFLWEDASEYFSRKVKVTSDHHQAMLLPSKINNCDILGLSTGGVFPVVEALVYTDTKCLCFQPHPEWTPKDSEERDIYFTYIERYLL